MVNGQEIERARKLAGWSQKKLASEVGVSERTIGNWERGASSPGMKEPQLLELLGPYFAASAPGLDLADVSDLDLLAEVAKRMSRGSQRIGGNDSGTSAKKRREHVGGVPVYDAESIDSTDDLSADLTPPPDEEGAP